MAQDDLPPGYKIDGGSEELPPGYELEHRGIATTLAGYISQGLAEMATAPFRGIHAAAEGAKTMREEGRMGEDVPADVQEAFGQLGGAELINKILPKALYSGGYLDQPAPETTGEKYAAAIGKGLSAAAAPELGLVAAGPRLARAAMTEAPGVIRRTAADIGKFYAEKPGVGLATGGAAAATSAAGAEAAHEAELGPGYELAAGMAAPVAGLAPLAAASKGAQALEFVGSRMGVPTLTPSATIAGWEARGGPWRAVTSPFSTARDAGRWLNDLILAPKQTVKETLESDSAMRILRRVGMPLSADVPPTATPTVDPLAEVNARAYQVLANQLMRAGRTPDDIATVLNNFAEFRRLHSSGLAQNTMFMADVDPALTSLGGAVARSSPGGLPLEAVISRQTGVTPMTTTPERMAELGLPTRARFAPPMTGAQARRAFENRFYTPRRSFVPMGQQEVIEDAFRRALLIESQPHHGHKVSGLRTIEQMELDRQAESGPAYNKAYAAARSQPGPGASSLLPGEDVDFRPAVLPVLNRWEAALAQEPESVVAPIRKGIAAFSRALNADVTAIPLAQRQTMLERLDRAKRAFDESVLNPMYKPGEKSPWTAGVVTKFKQDVLAAIDGVQEQNVGPLYKTARDIWASRSETIDDIRLGMDAWKADSELGADVMRGANPNVRLGLFEGFRLQAVRMKTGEDVSKLFDNKRIMAIIAEAIPKTEAGGRTFTNRAQRFGGFISAQQAQVRTLTEIARGSPTAARTKAMQDLEDMHVIVETASKKGVKGIAMEVAYTLLNKAFGYRANTSDALARMLFTADLASNRATIEGIRQHMGPDRFSYFTRMLAQMMAEGSAARGAVPSAAVTLTQQDESTGP